MANKPEKTVFGHFLKEKQKNIQTFQKQSENGVGDMTPKARR